MDYCANSLVNKSIWYGTKLIRGELSNLPNRTHFGERYVFTSSHNYGIKPKKNLGAERQDHELQQGMTLWWVQGAVGLVWQQVPSEELWMSMEHPRCSRLLSARLNFCELSAKESHNTIHAWASLPADREAGERDCSTLTGLFGSPSFKSWLNSRAW